MKLEIISKTENPLLERTEVSAKASGYEATPNRAEIAEHVAKALSCDKDCVHVLKVGQAYGAKMAHVTAQVYKSASALGKTVHKKRMLRSKAAGGAEQKKEEAKPAQKKEEKKAEAEEKKEAPAEKKAEEKK